MKLLQRILVLVMILASTYISVSYADSETNPFSRRSVTEQKTEDKQQAAVQGTDKNSAVKSKTTEKETGSNTTSSSKTNNKRSKDNKNNKKDNKKSGGKGKVVNQPDKKPSVSPEPKKTQPEMKPMEKIKLRLDLTREELEQAVKEFPLYLTNWDLKNMRVQLCDIQDSNINELFTIYDLYLCDFDRMALMPGRTGTFTVYYLELRDVPYFGIEIKAKPSIMFSETRSSAPIDWLDEAVFKKPVICMIPYGMEWKNKHMYPGYICVYDANTGSRVNEIVSQEGGIVMFDSLNDLIRYFSLCKASQ